jgi:hypothetical protein
MTTTRVPCKQCETPMQRTELVQQSRGLQAVGLLLFLIGCALLFAFPIGTVAGVLVIFGAWRMGYSRKPIWKCPACSYFFERAD